MARRAADIPDEADVLLMREQERDTHNTKQTQYTHSLSLTLRQMRVESLSINTDVYLAKIPRVLFGLTLLFSGNGIQRP